MTVPPQPLTLRDLLLAFYKNSDEQRIILDALAQLESRDQRIRELEAVAEAAKNYDENWLAEHMVAWAGDTDISDREVGEAEEAAHSLHAALAALRTVTPQAEQAR